jgi:hypothetical protein
MIDINPGTELYRWMLDFDYGDTNRKEIMEEVWRDTPWIIDTYTGSVGSDLDIEIRSWCQDKFGPESFPLIERPGQWHRGCATVHGWTWYGFATEEQMLLFNKHWRTRT